MASCEIDYHGLDDDLKKVIGQYPDKTLSFMRSEAGKWKKDCNAKGYDKSTSKSKKGKTISKSWKNIVEENNLHQVTEIQVQNQHPLFHLLENGHAKWLWGKNTGGFVAGKHWAEKTRAEWKDKFGDHVDKYVDKMLKEHNL